MGRMKVYAPATKTTTPATTTVAERAVLRAPAGPAPKPAAPKPAAPKPAITQQTEVNRTADFVAAAIVPTGKTNLAGRVEVVGPSAAYTAPAGHELRGFIHRDGSAVKFAGMVGEIPLDAEEAHAEFGTLIGLAQTALAAHPNPKPAAPKPAAPKKTPPTVQRATESSASPATHAASAVERAASQPGVPLAARSREKLEASYGTNLGDVRVHTDTAASQAAHAVNAHAYTTGQDIYFRAGQYNPGTTTGDKLLAHEVAHTVQQGQSNDQLARAADSSGLAISEPGDRAEREAEKAAEHAVRGQPVRLQGTAPAIARFAENAPAPAPAAPAPAKAEAAPAPAPAAPTQAPASPPAGGGAPNGGNGNAPPAADKQQQLEQKPKENAKTDKAASKGENAPAEGGGLEAVVAGVTAAGEEQKEHDPAEAKATEAQKAVGVTAEEAKGKGQQQQVGAMAAQKPGGFDKVAFKASLRAKIVALQADQAKDIKEGDQAQGINSVVKGEVAQGKAQAASGITQATQQEPSAPPPVPGPAIPEAKAGAKPAIDGGKAVPPPVPDEKVSMATESQAIDEQMASAKVTPEQLQKSNEPAFQAAATAKDTAKSQADVLPEQARASEQKVQATAKKDAAATTQAGLSEMHGTRAELFGQTQSQQTEGKGKHEEVKKRLAQQFEAIYTRTKESVDKRLAKLDEEVASAFDFGATVAKGKFYAYIGAKLLVHYLGGGWIVDAFTGENSKEKIFKEGRDTYMAEMDKVIDDVANVVETGLNDVVAIIAKGKAELDAEVEKLPAEEQNVGREVAQGIQSKFTELEKSVEDKQKAIIDSVAQKYVEAQKEVDAAINILRDPVGAAINYAKETIAGVIETLKQMRDLLLGILAKAGEAIDLILADPIGFLGNLIAGVRQGLDNFVTNIGSHLKKGFFDWLFGAVAKAGIQLPERFDLSGILSIVLQVLGLTWSNIRKRAVAIVGEKIVSALETASEIIITLVTKGTAGLWEWIKDQASTLMQTVIDSIQQFLIEKVIKAGVMWIIGLLNPASAFLKACKAIVDIVSWIMSNGQQLLAFVNAVLDSILSIAKGNIGPAAAAVEGALAKAVPVAIGFLASLLGLGGISDKIKEVIEKIQAPINAAIDWLIKKAVQLAKAVGKLFGGKDKKKDEDDPDPEHAAKVAAGLATLDTETAKVKEQGALTQEEAEGAAKKTKDQHPVFKSISVVSDGDDWAYSYEASPKKKKQAGKKEGGDPLVLKPGDMVTVKVGRQWLVAAVVRIDEKNGLVWFEPKRGKKKLSHSVSISVVKSDLASGAEAATEVRRGLQLLQSDKPEPYDRDKHYGKTPAEGDRKTVLKTKVYTGSISKYKGKLIPPHDWPAFVADHNPPLVKRYYDENMEIGGIAGWQQTPEERFESARDTNRMEPQPKAESNLQGNELKPYSQYMKEKMKDIIGY